MTAWPVGLSTGCFYRTPILDCLETIRASGFSMVEVVFSPEHLDFRDHAMVARASDAIRSLGMEVFSFHAPFGEDIDISSPVEADRRHSLRQILEAVEAAALLGVHYFVIHPGPENADIPSKAERLERIENVVGVLNEVAARCASLGIRCVLENKLPHLLFGDSTDILWILGSLKGTETGACLDTGHALLAGELHQLVHKLAPFLRMLHVHDNHGSADEHLPPGDGVIDWRGLLRDLARVRFQGTMILEVAGCDDPPATMERARRGRGVLREIARSVAMEALPMPPTA
jgi:sugar phosphate isomerase/epimerase